MYVYTEQRNWIFTDEGQRKFLQVRDLVKQKLAVAGCVRMQEIMRDIRGGGTNWEQMSCVDRLVELKELFEVPQKECAGQYRIFVGND